MATTSPAPVYTRAHFSLTAGWCGFSQTGPLTPDVVAPGDLGWALCSLNPVLFTDCVSFAGTATPIQDFGGTSESSPLTAGTAAVPEPSSLLLCLAGIGIGAIALRRARSGSESHRNER